VVTKPSDRDFLEAIHRAPNKSFRRYNLVFENGVAHFEQDPICRAFDEILEELYGPSADQE
jgi:hypothetical protein